MRTEILAGTAEKRLIVQQVNSFGRSNQIVVFSGTREVLLAEYDRGRKYFRWLPGGLAHKGHGKQ